MALDNDEIQMTNVERMSKHECPECSGSFAGSAFVIGILKFFHHSDFVIRHSYLSASIGSTLAARRAGSQQANSATAASEMATKA